MKHKGNWPVRVATAAIMLGALVGVAVAAGQQGTQNDPLVTLSYLEQKVTPSVLSQVDEKLNRTKSELTRDLQAVADSYAQKVGQQNGGSGGGTASAGFQVVTLQAGQKLIGGNGCEFLLRTGTAYCVSDSAPGLVDMTGGSTLTNGAALAANHLYLGTVEGRGVRASNAVTLMVRGSYTIR